MDGETVRDVIIRAIEKAAFPYPNGSYDPAFVTILPDEIADAIAAALQAHGLIITKKGLDD